jgi:O-antigen ligase/tetratricopeptide (TPR) repeat protein
VGDPRHLSLPAAPRTPADRLLESGWLALALLVPLVLNPWGESIFALPKAALLRTLVMAMVAISIADRLIRRRPAVRSLGESPLVVPLGALAAVIAAATAWAPDLSLAFWGRHGRAEGALTLVCLLVLTLLVAEGLSGVAAAKRIFSTAVATVLPLAAYAGMQLAGPDPLGIETTARSPVFAMLGRSNFLAAYLAMLLPLTLTLWWLAQRRIVRMLAMALGLLELALLLATQARAGWLAALVAVSCWAGLVLRHRLRGLAPSAWMWRLATGLAAVLTAVALWLAGAGGSGAARLAIWQATLKLITARPWLGYGPDSLGLFFPKVYPPELVYYQGRDFVVDRAHNLVLDWTATLGTLGLFAGAAVLFVVVRLGWRSLTTERDDRARELLIIGALAALAGNLANNLVSFDVVPTFTLSALLVGVVVGLARSRGIAPGLEANAEPHGAPNAAPNTAIDTGTASGALDTAASLRSGATARAASAALAVAVALAAIAAVAVFNIRPVVADVLSLRADRLVRTGDWSGAISAAERSTATFPSEPMYRQLLGWHHLQQALSSGSAPEEHLAAAERHLEEAIALRPGDYLLWTTLAEFHGAAALRFDRRHLGSAEKAWRKATTLAPNHATLYQAWGGLMLQAGNPREASRLLRKTVDLDATDSAAWLMLGDLELGRQDPVSALVSYRQAANHAPERPEPIVGLARTYWLLGQPEAAREAVRDALELDPGNSAAAALEQQFSEEPMRAAAEPE